MIYEEKTEEYANNKYCKFCKDLRFCNNNKCSKWDNTYTDYLNGLVEGRKEGYEQGYEDCRHYAHDYYKPKWHDLRENPNDLPKLADKRFPWSITVANQNGEACEYNYRLSRWQNCLASEIDEPIAWCEIPKFEE